MKNLHLEFHVIHYLIKGLVIKLRIENFFLQEPEGCFANANQIGVCTKYSRKLAPISNVKIYNPLKSTNFALSTMLFFVLHRLNVVPGPTELKSEKAEIEKIEKGQIRAILFKRGISLKYD